MTQPEAQPGPVRHRKESKIMRKAMLAVLAGLILLAAGLLVGRCF